MKEHTSEEKEHTFGDAVRATAIAALWAISWIQIGFRLNPQHRVNPETQSFNSNQYQNRTNTNSVMELNGENPILVEAFSTTYQK